MLVNNAGGSHSYTFEDWTADRFQNMIDLNLKSAFVLSQRVAPHMRERGSGSIVNISSGAAVSALPIHTAYGAAKAGLENLTQNFAAALAPHGIRVNCVRVGAIKSEGFLRAMDGLGIDPDEMGRTRGRPRSCGHARRDRVARALPRVGGVELRLGPDAVRRRWPEGHHRVTTRPIGIVGVAFADIALDEMATRAADLGFDHLDAAIHLVEPLDDDALAALAVPIVDRISGFELVDGCTFVAPYERRGEDRFDETVALMRAHPTARLEPGPHTSAGSIEKIEALAAAVPGLQLTLDTGHVAWWGEDPVQALRHAGHVQLRQAAKGRPQLYPDEGGDVDFAAVLAELDRLDYRGALSIEYFDLPDMGWGLDDPVGHCVAVRDPRPFTHVLSARSDSLSDRTPQR